MASNTSEFSFETDMSFDISTAKEAPTEDNEVNLKLYSFLSLFEKIGISKVDEEYVIAENPSAGTWESLFETARMVRDLDVHKEAGREMARVCPSVFVRLAQHLKGGLLFPNLRDVSIVDLNSSTHYLPLLASPVLESVLLAVDPESGSVDKTIRLSTYAFLGDLFTFAPNLQSLVIKNVVGMSPLWLDKIAHFHHLQALTLSSLDVKSFENLRPLGSLTNLQDLSLVFQYQEYEQLVLSDRYLSLPSLKYLHIVGPFDVMVDFIRVIKQNDLEKLNFECTHQPSPRSKKVKGLKSTLAVRRQEKFALSLRNDFLSLLSFLWAHSLKEVTILSTVLQVWELARLAPLRILEKLHIEGSLILDIEQTIRPPSALWHCLRSLHLPANFTVSFCFIQQIAESTPFLNVISLFMDVTKDPGIGHIQALFHPLESLTILHGGIETNPGPGNHEAYDDISWLRLMKVARYLNALFPNLRQLDAMVQKREWDRVWELVKLCRDSLADEKGRKQVQVKAVS